MDGELRVFPSVSALSLEATDESIFLRQHDDYQQRIDAVEVPRVFLPVLIKALLSALGPAELKAVGHELAIARRAAEARVGSNG